MSNMKKEMTFPRLIVIVAFFCASLLLSSAGGNERQTQPSGQEAPKFQLTVESIMRGPKLVGYAPTGLRWSGDSKELYFEWRRPDEDEASTYVVSRNGGEPRKLSDEEKKKIPPAGRTWDTARRRVLFVENDDIVLFDAMARTRRQITRTTAVESNPRWARNETAFCFTRDNNLFVIPLDSGTIEQLTDIRPHRREPLETDSQKFLKAEEQKLIEVTKLQVMKKQQAEEKQKKDALPVFEIQGNQAVQPVLSPDNIHVFINVIDRAEGARIADVPNYLTESAYTENIPTRTKVGDTQDRQRLAVLNLKTGKSVWAESSFAGMKKTEVATSGGTKEIRDTDREVSWGSPVFSKDGKLAVVIVSATDYKDRWIVVVDPETGKSRVIDALHDDAWVLDTFSMRANFFSFMPDEHTIHFIAEHDGWMHLYVVDAAQEGAKRRQLTSGMFEITSATLSPDRKLFYLTTSEKHLGERHFYTMPLDGGARTQVTMMTGSNIVTPSPDATMLGIVYSYINKPPEVYLMANTRGAQAKQVTTTPTEEWRSFKWADAQVITFKARDGVDVYARLFTPEMLGAKRDPAAPGVVFVHGAGYAQNAHKYWASYYREYMFDNLLASRGYVVLDLDYRASSGYGRDWRTAIYRHMGGKDLEDVVDGAKYLVEMQNVNPKRVGVYGGSYGGFMTLMVMFTSPDTFTAGAALRPVTDWAHYNHMYSGNILNEPQHDPEAYRQSSPIYFADKLKGALLICHGLIDTNVHIQDSFRLAQRLIELRKENWELAVYPVENHGFQQETSWVDEYKRILKLFEEHLRLPK